MGDNVYALKTEYIIRNTKYAIVEQGEIDEPQNDR
jgi:hypothetical protein